MNDHTIHRGFDIKIAGRAEAKLDAADLTNARLPGADLHRASEDSTIWTGADLSGASRTDDKRARAEDFVPGGSP